MRSAQDQDTGGREKSERNVVVASLVLCSPACTECFVLLTRSTGLHFPVPRCLLFCFLHCYTVYMLSCRQAPASLPNCKAERINTKLHLTRVCSFSLAGVEEGVERNEQALVVHPKQAQ